MHKRRACLIIAILCAISGCATTPTGKEGRDLAQVYADMGAAYLKRGQREEARDKLERALKLNPNLPSANHYIAELYHQTGDDIAAERHFRRAVELSPNDPNLQNNFGVFLCDQKKLADAEKYFHAAIKNPSYRTPELAYENAGLCALRAPDETKAEQYFRTALKIQPKLPTSLHEMAKLGFAKNDFLLARAYTQRYLEIAPPTAEILWVAVRTERELGDVAAANRYATMLSERFPDTKELRQLQSFSE